MHFKKPGVTRDNRGTGRVWYYDSMAKEKESSLHRYALEFCLQRGYYHIIMLQLREVNI